MYCIKSLVAARVIVVASGGGGIPVIEKDGRLVGVEAVIDKDMAGQKLAEVLHADIFLALTDVEYAYLNYEKPNQESLGEIKVSQAEKYLAEGHFHAGNMGPKVLACVRFVRAGGERAIITSLDKAVDALQGKAGTQIVP